MEPAASLLEREAPGPDPDMLYECMLAAVGWAEHKWRECEHSAL